MLPIFLESLIQVLPVIILAGLYVRRNNWNHWVRLFMILFFFIVYRFVGRIPALNENFVWVDSKWNWEGKVFGLIWGICSYFLLKNGFRENNFLTIKQDRLKFRKPLLVASFVVILSSVIWYVLGESVFNLEALAFQLVLPGLDEEIFFRGIILGLFSSALLARVRVVGNPAILLSSILFGLSHALQINTDYKCSFEPLYFVQTGFAGYLWGWVTIQSRSILLAVLSHNFSNFFGTLATMIK